MTDLESTAVEVEDTDVPETRALVPAAPALAVTPQVQATELVARLSVIREAQEKAMVEDVDYGVIPGTDKPTLYKPGSEKLSVLFQLDVQLVNEKVWGPGEHLTVISHATVYHAPTSARLGYGEGICTTRERKYAYRKQERTCPICGATAVIKGKAEYGGGWLCWKKRDGCGAKFQDGDPQIEGQDVSDIENPDLPDLWNTVTKMAEKRARVDAVLAVTGASALFTQDMEDQPDALAPEESAPRGKSPGRASGKPSEAQQKFLKSLLTKNRVTEAQLRVMLVSIGAPEVGVRTNADGLGEVQMADLTAGKEGSCSALIDALTKGPLPDVEHPSDVPSDFVSDTHPEAQADPEDIPF